MAGTIVVDRIESDGSYSSTVNVASKVNFAGGIQIGGVDATVGNRNRITNGDMRIDQRNNGSSVAIPTGTSNIWPVDRWRCQNLNGSSDYSAQRVADAPAGFTHSLKITTTTATSVSADHSKHMWLPIEGYDVADLDFGSSSAKPVTISFWVKSSKTGNFGASISADGGTRAYPYLYAINQANTWEYKTVTIPGDTTGTWLKDSGTGIRVNFNVGSGSNYTGTPNQWNAGGDRGAIGQVSLLDTLGATWQITGVQLEKGSSATAFEYRPYAKELALCQRYYETCNIYYLYGMYISSYTIFRTSRMSFAVTKRATPSGSVLSGTTIWTIPGQDAYSADSAAGITFSASTSSYGFTQTRQAGNSAPTNMQVYLNENGTILAFSAEL